MIGWQTANEGGFTAADGGNESMAYNIESGPASEPAPENLFHWGGTHVYNKTKTKARQRPTFYEEYEKEQQQKEMLENLESEIQKHANSVDWTEELDKKLAALAVEQAYDFEAVAADLSNSIDSAITEAAARIRFTELEVGRKKPVAAEFVWNAEQDNLVMELAPELMYDFVSMAASMKNKLPPGVELTGDMVRCRFASLDS